ncbi:multifunctional acyl-CoA thioesterase I/protease I/lysophospholipase L1 [Psychromonas sp.]|uniref:multifunctional acyl-CoA thioesterase I/protease I/lysophospholipase L1 n=1 Tax=Psychromonas sp. TaxID=1884585 RepID=UPI0039E387A6
MTKIFSLCFALLFCAAANGQTLLILGDSLSAGYNMPIEQSWPSLLSAELHTLDKSTTVVNASISGDTTNNALARLPGLLSLHKPTSVLIELGANDGLRGFSPSLVKANLEQMISLIKDQNGNAILMQIQVPPNYGKRYSQAFSSLYPQLSQKYSTPLIPFFLEQVILKPQWMMNDGLHPTADAQPWIAQYMAEQLAPYLR